MAENKTTTKNKVFMIPKKIIGIIKTIQKNEIKKSIKDLFTRGLDFRGVSTRREFWIPFLLVGTIVYVIMPVIDMIFYSLGLSMFVAGSITSAICFIFLILLAIPMSALFVRRLHDAGYKGWPLSTLNIIVLIILPSLFVSWYYIPRYIILFRIMIFIVDFIVLLQGSNYNNNVYYEYETKKSKTSDKDKILRKNNIPLQDLFTRGLDFRGVSTRREFWKPVLPIAIIYAVMGVIVRTFDGLYMTSEASITSAICFIFSILLAIPMSALFVRRLHDTGYNAWPLSILNIIVSILALFAPWDEPNIINTAFVIILIVDFIVSSQGSDYDNNKYYEADKKHLLDKKSECSNASASSNHNTNNIDGLEKAYKLYKQKIITKKEFETIKHKVLK